MPMYKNAVFVLGFIINFLLILGSNQIFCRQTNLKTALLAAILGGIYCAACLVPQLHFLGKPLWRVLCLMVTALVAFGCVPNSIRVSLVFLALNFAISGLSQERVGIKLWMLLTTSIIVLVLTVTGVSSSNYIQVELRNGKTNLQLTALRDTGNTLRDPVTGKPVLIVGADTAQKLTGLTQQQLRQPVETIGAIPGLRLIPYKAVGGGGLLLAMRFSNVKIGSWRGSSLVAFAPEVLSVSGAYQALTGGML